MLICSPILGNYKKSKNYVFIAHSNDIELWKDILKTHGEEQLS